MDLELCQPVVDVMSSVLKSRKILKSNVNAVRRTVLEKRYLGAIRAIYMHKDIIFDHISFFEISSPLTS